MLRQGLLLPFLAYIHNFVTNTSIQQQVSDFLTSIYMGLVYYVANIIFYAFFALALDIRLRYELLISLVVFVFLSTIYNTVNNVRSISSISFSYYVRALDFAMVFCMIVLALFTLLTVVFDKFTRMKELAKVLLSFLLPLVISVLFQYFTWVISISPN